MCAAQLFPFPEGILDAAQGFQIEGRDTLVFRGGFHYFRCPPELWPDRFRKIQAVGFNAVETCVLGNWHERRSAESWGDFSRLLDMHLPDDWEWLVPGVLLVGSAAAG